MPNPKEGGVSLSKNKIWSGNTGRDTTGHMTGTIKAIITKLEIQWENLTQAEAGLIDSVVSDAATPFTTVSYVDVNGTNQTMTAYFGDPVYGIKRYDVDKKQQTYDSVSVSTVQQ